MIGNSFYGSRLTSSPWDKTTAGSFIEQGKFKETVGFLLNPFILLAEKDLSTSRTERVFLVILNVCITIRLTDCKTHIRALRGIMFCRIPMERKRDLKKMFVYSNPLCHGSSNSVCSPWEVVEISFFCAESNRERFLYSSSLRIF